MFEPFGTPFFMNVFNSFGAGTLPPFQTLETQIVVIHKDDPQSCARDRPISILNVELKMFIKILLNRLLPLISALIHTDQMGFMPRREDRVGTLNTIIWAQK